MKRALTASLALALSLTGIETRYAQSAPTPKMLAIGTIDPGVDQAQVNAILPSDVKDTVNLYLEGKIDQWYSLQDRKGGGVHSECHRPCGCTRNARKAALGSGSYHEL